MSAPLEARAAVFHRHRVYPSRQTSAVTLRKRLHINDLITEPGTVEADWGVLYSFTTGMFTLPSALKYTPDGNSLFWGPTEYSLAFDSVSSAINAGVRSTQFSDRLTLAATSVVFDSVHLDIAIAPQATLFLRDESGARLGATVIARCDAGGNSMGVTATWTAATSTSDTNPAGVWDFGAGFGRPLARAGTLARITPHVNAVFERATGFSRTTSAFGGVEYQVTNLVGVDFSAQRYNLTGGSPDRQFLVALTANFGHPKPAIRATGGHAR